MTQCQKYLVVYTDNFVTFIKYLDIQIWCDQLRQVWFFLNFLPCDVKILNDLNFLRKNNMTYQPWQKEILFANLLYYINAVISVQ